MIMELAVSAFVISEPERGLLDNMLTLVWQSNIYGEPTHVNARWIAATGRTLEPEFTSRYQNQ